MNKLIFVGVFSLGLGLATAVPVAAAVNPLDEVCNSSGGGQTSVCQESDSTGGNSVLDMIQAIANTLLVLTGIVCVIMIIYGGFKYVTSSGDSSDINKAKNTILGAVIGLVVAAAAFGIVNYVLSEL